MLYLCITLLPLLCAVRRVLHKSRPPTPSMKFMSWSIAALLLLGALTAAQPLATLYKPPPTASVISSSCSDVITGTEKVCTITVDYNSLADVVPASRLIVRTDACLTVPEPCTRVSSVSSYSCSSFLPTHCTYNLRIVGPSSVAGGYVNFWLQAAAVTANKYTLTPEYTIMTSSTVGFTVVSAAAPISAAAVVLGAVLVGLLS